ncbi:MAG: hypothetical protein ACREVW_14210 [Burkholderiales bacterium]
MRGGFSAGEGLKLETTKTDCARWVVGLVETTRRLGSDDVGIRCNRHGKDRQHGYFGNRDLDLSSALIAGGVLLQAGVLVDRLFAIALVIRVGKGHGRRLSGLDAGLCNADRLGEKHPCRKKAADCTTKSGTAKYHEFLISTG